MPEDEGVEHGLACRVEGPMQGDITAGLSATAVLAVYVAVNPLHQQVSARSYSAGGKEKGQL